MAVCNNRFSPVDRMGIFDEKIIYFNIEIKNILKKEIHF